MLKHQKNENIHKYYEVNKTTLQIANYNQRSLRTRRQNMQN
jgi:hypothetical protein